jgi:hypothetical protein
MDGGFGAYSGPSRGDPGKRAFRPSQLLLAGPTDDRPLDVDDSVNFVSRYLCANDFESEVICQPIVRW